MDAKIQTSFIPQKAFSAETGFGRPAPSMSIFLFISIIIFIVTLSLAAGVFLYQRSLVGKIAQMDALLSAAEQAFEPALINSASDLSKKVNAAKTLILRHKVVSPVFNLLERDTLSSVRFDDFQYSLKATGESTIALSGTAKNFNSVALQSDVFSKDKVLKNPVFSDLALDQKGNVTFKFTAIVDPSLILYKNIIGAAASTTATAAGSSAAPPSSPSANSGVNVTPLAIPQ